MDNYFYEMRRPSFHSEDLLSVVKTRSYCDIKYFLEKHGFRENNHRNYLALIEVVKSQNYKVVQLLLSYGCLAEEAKSDIFYKSLDYAIENVHDIKMLRILLQAGASIAGKSFNRKTPLIKAMEKKMFPAVDVMLSMYPIDSIDPTNKNDVIHFGIACVRNKVGLVEHFIRKGMNINVELDSYVEKWVGFTPLYLAVLHLSVDVVFKLLSYKANFIAKNQSGFSPLHTAYYIWKDNNSSKDHRMKASFIIDLFLLAHSSIVTNPIDSKGISHFYIACVRNDVELVKDFLLSGVSLIVERNTVSHLHNAVKHNCLEVTDVLLSYGLKVDLKDRKGRTALHIAVYCRFYDVVKILLKYNANVQIVDKQGLTPIHIAFFHLPDSGEIIDLMLSECSKKLKNVKCLGNLSLFHIACTRSNIALVEDFMLQCNIDLNEQVDTNFVVKSDWQGFTALHFAVCTRNLEIIELLLKSNAYLNATDTKGATALWHALDSQPNYHCVKKFILNNFADELTTNSDSVKQKIIDSIYGHFRHIRILELLLISGSDPNYKNVHGVPLLFQAYQSIISHLINIDYEKQDFVSEICLQYFYDNSNKIIQLFIFHGINRNSRDRVKNSIFHFIITSMGHHEQVTKIALKVADLLIISGGNPTLVNNEGDSPFFMAIKSGSIEFVKLLLKYNIGVNSTDRNLMTPLHIAMQPNHFIIARNGYGQYLKMIQFLLTNGSNINAKDINGETPLFKILYNWSIDAMKLLLEANCDIDAQDNYGRTVLSIAAHHNNLSAVNILLNYGADINIKDNSNSSLLKQVCLSNTISYMVFEQLIVHVNKLALIGYPVSIENLDICGNPHLIELTTIRAMRKELDVLKESELDQYTSLYDILFKSIQQMTRHVKNKTLVSLVNANALTDNFPHYGSIINLKYQQGMARIKIFKKAQESLQLLAKGKLLPDSCIDSIFSYVTNKDLENLSFL